MVVLHSRRRHRPNNNVWVKEETMKKKTNKKNTKRKVRYAWFNDKELERATEITVWPKSFIKVGK